MNPGKNLQSGLFQQRRQERNSTIPASTALPQLHRLRSPPKHAATTRTASVLRHGMSWMVGVCGETHYTHSSESTVP